MPRSGIGGGDDGQRYGGSVAELVSQNADLRDQVLESLLQEIKLVSEHANRADARANKAEHQLQIESERAAALEKENGALCDNCLLYTSPSPRDRG